MKLVSKVLFMSGILSIFSSYAAEPVINLTGTVAFTSDYLFRGVTQTDSGIAVQGSFDLHHQSGAYAGVWGSNVKFLEDETVEPEDRADVEIDVYVGYSKELTNGFSYGLKAARYMYPGAAESLNYEVDEFEISVGYAIPPGIKFGLAYDYSPDFAGNSGQAHHYLLTATQTYPNGVGFTVQVGQQAISDNERFGLDDYRYYGVSLSYVLADFNTAINYSNTDLDNAEDSADGRVYVSVSKSF